MSRSLALVLTVALLFALSNGASAAPPWYGDKTPPSSEADCRTKGGQWAKTPLFQTPDCRSSIPDGGKECRLATDCKSLICVIDTPEASLGKCHGEAERFATFWYLDERGKPQKISVE